jgi:hypothetical protein
MTGLRINLVTNWRDGKGLWRDGCLLESLLLTWGHQPRRVHFTAPAEAEPADLNVFIETIRSDRFPLAPRNWLIPNPEWFTNAELPHLPRFDRVLCKTREAERLFVPLTDKAVYTGFESEDRYDPDVPREAKVLHVAGGSILKGTQAVLDAWEQFAPPYPLTVVGDEQVVKPRQIPNVTYRLGRLPDDELKTLQNSHRVHLQPSEAEGWGHTIYEGLGCNALLLATDCDSSCGWFVPGEPHGSRGLATLRRVSPHVLCVLVNTVMTNGYAPWPIREGGAAREDFLRRRAQFRERLKELL